MREHGAFILARYSTDRQNPDSIEVQVEKCTKWCNENSIPILDVFADMAVSGMKDTRPQYSRMMQQLRNGGADTVVIYDQSRMFRKMTAWFTFRDELEAMGVTVVSVTQPMIGKDLRDPTNFLTEGSMALFNQIWALQTRQKVIEKMRFMARNGQHTGGRPALGYQVIDGRLEICEPEAAIVRRIFAEYASGKTYNKIIKDLNADGITTRAGTRFGNNSLHDILKNEKYIGVLTYGKTPRTASGHRNSHGAMPPDCIRLENAIPAIISMETWEKVQQKMAKNQRSQAGRPPINRDYPLKGKVFCALCKNAMNVSISNYKHYYYACGGKQRLHNCDLKPIRVDNLEQLVSSAIKETLGKPNNTSRLIQILRDERGKLQGGAADRLTALVMQQAEITQQLDQATTAILNGLNSPTLTNKIQDLERQKQMNDREMRRLKDSVTASALPEERLTELLNIIINETDPAAILSVVCRVEVGPETITIWTILDTDSDGHLCDDTDLDESNVIRIDGAADGTRTRTVSLPGDFKSPVSTDSTTAAAIDMVAYFFASVKSFQLIQIQTKRRKAVS